MSIFGFDYILEEDIEVPEEGDESFSISDQDDNDTSDTNENVDDTDEQEVLDDDRENKTDDTEDDFTLDNEGDTNEEEDNPEDDTNDVDTTADSPGEPGADDDIKERENEIMSDLSDEQKNIRDKELKTLYVDLYNSISNILLRLDRVVKTTDNIRTLNFCENRLGKIQNMLYDYLLETYKTKSYIQNISMYYMVIGTLTGIEQLIKSLIVSTTE